MIEIENYKKYRLIITIYNDNYRKLLLYRVKNKREGLRIVKNLYNNLIKNNKKEEYNLSEFETFNDGSGDGQIGDLSWWFDNLLGRKAKVMSSKEILSQYPYIIVDGYFEYNNFLTPSELDGMKLIGLAKPRGWHEILPFYSTKEKEV
jgi:hypothetical protein